MEHAIAAVGAGLIDAPGLSRVLAAESQVFEPDANGVGVERTRWQDAIARVRSGPSSASRPRVEVARSRASGSAGGRGTARRSVDAEAARGLRSANLPTMDGAEESVPEGIIAVTVGDPAGIGPEILPAAMRPRGPRASPAVGPASLAPSGVTLVTSPAEPRRARGGVARRRGR